MRAGIALAERDRAEALRHLRLAEDIGGCQICVSLGFAETFESMEQPDSAIVR